MLLQKAEKNFIVFVTVSDTFHLTQFLSKIWSPNIKILGLRQAGESFLTGEGASLPLVARPSSDGVILKIPYEIDVSLHRPTLHPTFSYWVGRNLNLNH